MQPYPGRREGVDTWGFAFHSACWEILCLARDGQEPNIQALFDVCRSFPMQEGIINYGHDYGARAFFTRHRKPREVVH